MASAWGPGTANSGPWLLPYSDRLLLQSTGSVHGGCQERCCVCSCSFKHEVAWPRRRVHDSLIAHCCKTSAVAC